MPDVVIGGQVGEVRGAAGTNPNFRQGAYCEQIVNDTGLGRYFEAVRWGRAFSLSTPAAGVAGAATQISPLAAVTGTPLVGIFNPTGSNKAAAILSAAVFFTNNGAAITGVPGVVWNVIPNPAGITAAGGAGAVSARLDNTAASAMRTFVNVVPTGLVGATMLRYIEGGAALVPSSTTINGSGWQFSEETAGRILVSPGAFAGLATSIGLTSYNVGASMVWAEVDWPL